ncbi:hypothetical protein PRIPAC_71386 [Pristionchus pacificus]|uniref:ILCR1 Ig-like domain-containing protein n=1 Tax=Pristionchus pacificus TaxID=54126 RepID=A0A2A6B4T2_PRIPA|nr:hypothetical protein PRIPAC_71386 [Pristionchus pacificus]|eukprot:PDM60868.1 hypothetical protein PRIPAC_54674 [Pristionchus pacificus]
MKLLLLLHLLSLTYACSLHKQTDAGLLIKLKAMWRVLKSEKFPIPITAFEISLHDITENRLIEVRTDSISSPFEGIRKLSETVDFFTHFSASLEFGHDYEIELRFLPLGTNGSFKKRLSIPEYPASGKCERDSALALDKDKYAIFVSDTKKLPLTASVRIEFHTAPPAFCFREYTVEVYETDNPSKPLAKSIVLTTDSTQVIKQEFPFLPVGTRLSIKIYPTEALHSRASECVCSNCNCLVTQTKSFLFPSPVIKTKLIEDAPKVDAPSISTENSSFLGLNLIFIILIPFLIVVIALLGILIRNLKINQKRPKESKIKLISEWNREEKMPIVGSPPFVRKGAIWVIGLNAMEEYRFIHKLSSHLQPFTRLIFAPDDLHDGVNRWKWIGDVNRGVDVIILLLRESSLSIYAAGKSPDPFESLFIEQMTSLHPSDHRIISVSLDDCSPNLFNSSSILYRDPRDFPLLTQCLSHRGFPLSQPITPITQSQSNLITPPLSPAVSLRSESVSEMESSIEGDRSKDSGFISNPSPPISPGFKRSAFPYVDSVSISCDNTILAN